ncbi:MAG: hypothetical protein NT018_11985 [Armatimonadetes bacterium]|nr:hypothetical protein [Armatimonadota bacterium]
MPKRLIITKVCFHITAVLLLLGAVFMAFVARPLASMMVDMGQGAGNTPDSYVATMVSVAMGVMSSYALVTLLTLCVLAIGIELVIYNLSRLRYWAWIVGIVICGLLILPVLHGNVISAALGGFGLWGLVDPDSVKAFQKSNEPVNSETYNL